MWRRKIERARGLGVDVAVGSQVFVYCSWSRLFRRVGFIQGARKNVDTAFQ